MTQIIHNEPVSFKTLIGNPEQDFIRANQSECIIEHNCIIDPEDKALRNKAHRDAIQGLPPDKGKRLQLALAELYGLTIRYNHVYSENALQGLFSSDGLYSNLHIHNNFIQTKGRHFISINGMLSGAIRENYTENGNLAPVYLGPARIGGRPEGGISVYVIGFADRVIEPIENIIGDVGCHWGHVTDERLGHVKPRMGDVYLYDFQLSAYQSEINEQSEIEVLEPQQMQEIALDYGKPIYYT